jgi:hypothetical protein
MRNKRTPIAERQEKGYDWHNIHKNTAAEYPCLETFVLGRRYA